MGVPDYASSRLRVSIRCEGNTLDLLLRRVIGNAVAHSPAGAEITIECRVENSGVALTIATPAEELLASDLQLIFERFWSKDAARREDGHSGLGLALVRAYATRLSVQTGVLLNEEGQFVLHLAGFTLAAPEPCDPAMNVNFRRSSEQTQACPSSAL